MNTAVATLDSPLTPAKAPNRFVDGFTRLDGTRKFMLGFGALALLGLLITAALMIGRPEYRVLFANLAPQDGGAVIEQLTQMGIPYRHVEGGNAILVPANRVHDLRLQLAAQGLPRGGVTGFEIMDSARLGMTQFQERVTFQRGLEGELVRSITSLNAVADARVHLALPQQTGFFREQQKPSASVLLTLHGGRTLDRTQIAGIVHLVASSVPELNPKAVSVVDQHGTLLSQSPEQGNGIDSRQLEYRRMVEQMYTQRINDLLEPLLGRANVRAQVTADIDFSVTEQTNEQFRPNQTPNEAAVRSTQLLESGAQTDLTTPGVPGAVANLPPGAAAAPINAPDAAPTGIVAGQNVGGGTTEATRRREQVTNFEVDRLVSVTRGATGNIRRLSAAVVIDHVQGTDRRGEPTTTPLPPEQLEQINALVREAIGFSEQRGDSVNIMNSAFNRTPVETVELAWWEQPLLQDLARTLAWPLGLLLLALIVFLGMVRPGLKMMAATPAADSDAAERSGGQLDTLVDNETQRPGLPAPVSTEPTIEMLRLEDAKRLARENPVAVANIVRGWMSGESTPATT